MRERREGGGIYSVGKGCGPHENVDRCVVRKMCGVNERR